MIRHLSTVLFLFLCAGNGTQLYAQYSLSGTVVDSASGSPLAFVNLVANENYAQGTSTNIDGRFQLSSATPIHSVAVSYIGYRSLELKTAEIGNRSEGLLITLVPTSIQLQEVAIRPGENPAIGLLRKVIANKDLNNPKKISSFQYESYNKLTYNLSSADTSSDKYKQVQKNLKGAYLMLMESTTRRKFKAPDKFEEEVLATKVSGFKHPTFAAIVTDFQPFSFYDEYITVADVNYLNPICYGCLNKYNFQLEDTLYRHQDTTYIVSFEPKKGKNFSGLKGLLYINTRQYALQNVLAEPASKTLLSVKFRQEYRFLEGQHWFPYQLDFELRMEGYPAKSETMVLRGKSYLQKVVFEPDWGKKKFALESAFMNDSANLRDEAYWQASRPDTLNFKEQTTYEVIDSLGEELKFDQKLRMGEKLAQGRIPIKFVDLDLTQTLLFNQYEGTRWGMGLVTNEQIWKPMELGAHFGYGNKDKRWKFGTDLRFTLSEAHELEVGGNYDYDVQETGFSSLQFANFSPYNLRNYIASRMDRVERQGVLLGFRTLRYLKVQMELESSHYTPLYGYQYAGEEIEWTNDYRLSQAKVQLRYAFKEKLVRSLNQRISQGTDYPVLYFAVTQAWKNRMEGDIDLSRIEAVVEHSMLLKNLGKTSFRLEAGLVKGDLPYGQLFTGEGAFDDKLVYVTPNYFQTIRPYEFLSDRFARLHFSHNFGSLLYRTEKFAPNLVLQQSLGWGDLSQQEVHESIDFRTMKQGLIESGLVVENLLRFKYLNIMYVGLGLGAFYRYGAYAAPNAKDNLALKLAFTISTQ